MGSISYELNVCVRVRFVRKKSQTRREDMNEEEDGDALVDLELSRDGCRHLELLVSIPIFLPFLPSDSTP